MRLVKLLLLVYLLLKPYYIFSSGEVQIGDLLLILAFLVYFIVTRLNKNYRKRFAEAISSNTYLIVFIFCVFFINLMYFMIFNEFKFLLSTVYFIFNLLAVILFSDLGKNKSFLGNVSNVLKFNLIVQLAISTLGVGRSYDAVRYMSTFNDPNQFAFYVLLSYLLIYVIQIILSRSKSNDLVYFLIALYLIFQSASTGNLLGLGVFIVLRIAYSIIKDHHITFKRVRAVFASLLVGGVTLFATAFLSYTGALNNAGVAINNIIASQSITNRLTGKISKADNNTSMNILEDRGIDIVYKYPQYIMYGAGEGGYDRYRLATNNYGNEVHSTLLSMLFYYGIIPFIILVKWLYKKIKNANPKILIACVALFIESSTLLNQRQSLFWIMIVLVGVSIKGAMDEKNY